MPYVSADGRLSTATFEGGAYIDPEQYSDALEAKLEGRSITLNEAGALVIIDKPKSPEPEPEPELTPEALLEAAREDRATAYRHEADPLFFKWQRGEGSEQVWLDKVAEIRQRYPYPDGHGDEGGAP